MDISWRRSAWATRRAPGRLDLSTGVTASPASGATRRVPYSTHFMGLAEVEGADPLDVRLIVVPRDGYEVLDDWGELIGLKGSGSNSVVIDDVLIPADHAVPVAQLMGEWPMTTTQLPGGAIHDNPMYSGGFMGFAIAELTVVQVGAARAMLDEYEEMLGSLPIVSMSGNVTTKRYTDHDYQRCFGMALGWVDAAHWIMMRAGEVYMELATKAFKAGRVRDRRIIGGCTG